MSGRTRAGSDPESVRRQYADTARLSTRASFWSPPGPGESPHEHVLDVLREQGARRILEVGCGTGHVAARMAAELDAEVTATDVSAGMVGAASDRAVPALVADVTDLPFEDDAFDAVVALWMLYHVPDPDAGLAEIRRVLRPGGVLVAITNGAGHLRDLLTSAGAEPFDFTFSVENGEQVLSRHFTDVSTTRFAGRAEADHATAAAYLDTFLPEAARALPPYDGRRVYRGSSALFVAR